jgi:thiol-disulfide isomerase/thioredoxin
MIVQEPAKVADARAVVAPVDASHAAPPAARREGPLCASRPSAPDGPVPPPPGVVLATPGAPEPAAIDPGGTRWSWINLWAAWCVPCREEMPLLRSWVARLQGEGVPVDLGLVSLDDDERQLRQFLSRATGALPRASLWVEGGSARTRWLKSVGLRDSPGLPVQILVKPGGTLACTIQGAVEAGDYDEVRGLFTATATP